MWHGVVCITNHLITGSLETPGILIEKGTPDEQKKLLV